MSDDLNTEIKIGADASGVEAGVSRAKRSIASLGDAAKKAGKDGSDGLAGIGAGGDKAVQAVERSTKNMQGQIQRLIASFEGGEHGSRQFYESLARQRGVDVASLKPLLDQLDAVRSKSQQAAAASTQVGKSFSELRGSADSAARALAAVGVGLSFAAITQGAISASKAMFSASAEAERLRIMLNFSTGGKGAQEIEYLRGVTHRLGLEFSATAKAYGQFQAAAKGTSLEGDKARAVFESVAKASAVMGLSVEESSGVLLALQQMVSKGTVQAEELRGQLGERLPGAFQIAAKAMGVTTAELGKMLEQGKVISEDFLPKFGKALEENIGGAADKAAQRLDAAVNRFDAAWKRAKQNAGDSGVSEAVAKGLSGGAGSLDALSIAMEQARKQGAGFWGQLGAVSGAMYDLSTQSSRNIVNMYDNAEATKKAQTELARLQRIAATEGTSAWVLKEIGAVNRYIGTLQQAKRDRDALENSAAGKPDPNMNAGVTASGQARERFNAQRAKDLEAANSFRLNQAGVPPSYLKDMAELIRLNQAGVLVGKEYTEALKKQQDTLLKKTGVVKASGAADSQEQNAYAALISSITQKIEAERQEMAGGDKLTASQRERIKLDADLAAGRVKLTAAQVASVRASLDMLSGIEAQNSAAKEAMKIAQALEAARNKEAMAAAASVQGMNDKAQAMEDEATAYGKTATELQALTIARLQDNKAIVAGFDNAGDRVAQIDAEIAALTRLGEAQTAIADLKLGTSVDEVIRASNAQAAAYRDEFRLIGLSATERAKVVAARKVELDYAKKIADLDKSGASDAKKDAERIRLRAQEQIESAAAVGQAVEAEWSKTIDQYDDLFRTGFQQMILQGESGIKAFGKTLKAQVYTSIADAIYQALARKFVVNIVGNFLGTGAGGAVQALAGGGGGGVMGLANNASSAYSLYSNLGAVSSGLSAFGNSLLATTQSMAGMTGTTAQMVQSLQAAGYWTGSANSTMATTWGANLGGGGAASGSGTGAFAGFGTAAAAVAFIGLVANAAGFFASDKIVGNGLYGQLGGDKDLAAYNLRREGGTLFNGPEYSLVDPITEMKNIEERIAKLQRGEWMPGAGMGMSGGDVGIAKLQNRLNELQALYGDQVGAAKAQSDAIQGTFNTLRTSVGDMADSLGLGSDAVRQYTTALGTDKIHPDVNTLGISFDGLTQEEISAKIAEALKTASNEMAEMLIGSWSSVTDTLRKITTTGGSAGADDGQDYTYSIAEKTSERLVYTASEFARSGEKAIDTLTRLAGSLGAVNGVFDLLGVTLYEASLAGGDAASKFLDAFGGAEAFAASTGAFYEAYYTEAERMGQAADALAAEFAKTGQEMPATKDAYRALVKEQLEAGAGSAELAAKLLQLSPAFAQVTDFAAQAQAALLDKAGISGDTVAKNFLDAMLGRVQASDAGAAIADMVTGGIYNAIAGGLAQQLTDLMMTSLITPVVQAAVAGASISEAVSQSAIDSMVAQARAAADALGQIFSDPAFRAAIDSVAQAIAGVTQAAGAGYKPYQSATAAPTFSGQDIGTSAPTALLKNAWEDMLADIVRQTQDARKELASLGMTSYESALASIAQKGQDAVAKLQDAGYMRAERDERESARSVRDTTAKALEMFRGKGLDESSATIQKLIERSAWAASEFDRLSDVLAQLPPEVQAMVDAERALLDARNKSQADKTVGQLLKEIAQLDMTDLERQLSDIADRAAEYRDGLLDLGQGTDANISAVKAWEDAMIAAAQNGGGAAASLSKTTDDAFAALQRAVEAQRTVVQETISHMQAIFDITRDGARDLYGEVEGARTQSAAAGRAFIDNALANAKATGYMPDADGLREAIEGVRRGLADQQGATSFEAERDRLVLAGKLTDLKDLAEPQLTEAQRQLKTLDETLENARQQIDVLRGIDVSVLSVSAALQALAAAIATERVAAPVVSGGGGGGVGSASGGTAAVINSVYQTLFGRDAEQAGLDYWTGQNMSISEITAAIAAGAQNDDRKKLPGFAVGINRVPYDMTARIHEGEAVIPAQFNPFNPNAMGGNTEVVAELRALRTEVAALRAAGERTASNTSTLPQMVDQIDSVTEGGNAMRAEVMA